jgi:hypothetical protein
MVLAGHLPTMTTLPMSTFKLHRFGHAIPQYAHPPHSQINAVMQFHRSNRNHPLVLLTFNVSTLPPGAVSVNASLDVRFWPLEVDDGRLELFTRGHASKGLALFGLSISSSLDETLVSGMAGGAPGSEGAASFVVCSSTSVRASSSFSRSRVRFCASDWKRRVGLIVFRVNVFNGLSRSAPSALCSSRPRSFASISSSSSPASSNRR